MFGRYLSPYSMWPLVCAHWYKNALVQVGGYSRVLHCTRLQTVITPIESKAVTNCVCAAKGPFVQRDCSLNAFPYGMTLLFCPVVMCGCLQNVPKHEIVFQAAKESGNCSTHYAQRPWRTANRVREEVRRSNNPSTSHRTHTPRHSLPTQQAVLCSLICFSSVAGHLTSHQTHTR